jgi:hypothetical protein
MAVDRHAIVSVLPDTLAKGLALGSAVAVAALVGDALARDLQDTCPYSLVSTRARLRACDISSLALSCRRFHNIVGGSFLFQYAYRTDLAGVYDLLVRDHDLSSTAGPLSFLVICPEIFSTYSDNQSGLIHCVVLHTP